MIAPLGTIAVGSIAAGSIAMGLNDAWDLQSWRKFQCVPEKRQCSTMVQVRSLREVLKEK